MVETRAGRVRSLDPHDWLSRQQAGHLFRAVVGDGHRLAETIW